MELLILAFILGGLIVLSLRYGYDSRSAPYANEHEQAKLGVVWELETLRLSEMRRDAAVWHAHRRALAQATPRRRVRRRLAAGLRALALRLNPELGVAYAVNGVNHHQQVAGC